MPDKLVSFHSRLGPESCRSKAVQWQPSPRWLEQLELHIQDVGAVPDLELKLKDSKSRELGR